MGALLKLLETNNLYGTLNYLNSNPNGLSEIISIYKMTPQNKTFIEYVIEKSGNLIEKFELEYLRILMGQVNGSKLSGILYKKIKEFEKKIISFNLALAYTIISFKRDEPNSNLFELAIEKGSKNEKAETIKNEIMSNEQSRKTVCRLQEIIYKLMKTEQVNSEDDIKCIGGGVYSIAYKFGNKILKIGPGRETWEILDNPYCLAPQIRKKRPIGNEKNLYIEVSDYVEKIPDNIPFEILKEKLYKIYKGLRDIGIVWMDVKPDNVGILTSQNPATLINENVEGIIPNPKYKKDITLKAGDWIILDVDGLKPIEKKEEIILQLIMMRDELKDEPKRRKWVDLMIEFWYRYEREKETEFGHGSK